MSVSKDQTTVFFQVVHTKGRRPIIQLNFHVGIAFQLRYISQILDTIEEVQNEENWWRPVLIGRIAHLFKGIPSAAHINLMPMPLKYLKVSNKQYNEILKLCPL